MLFVLVAVAHFNASLDSSQEHPTSNGNEASDVGTADVVDSSLETGVDQLARKPDQAMPTDSASNQVPNMPVEMQNRVDSTHESSGVSSSESEGSAMDESSDSGSEDSMSIDEDDSEDPAPVSEPKSPNATSEPPGASEEGADQPCANSHHPLPQGSPAMNTENAKSVASESDEEVEMSRDNDSSDSSGSDAYEPPEPETTASPANSVYSPPFSPPPPGPIEPSEASMSTVNQTNPAGEPLTAKDQEVDVEPARENFQLGLLDV